MEYLEWSELSEEEQRLLKEAKASAEKSVSQNNHKVGCVIQGKNGNYSGATVSHPRIIGSTCAERMAIDNLLINRDIPQLCALVGKLNRENWQQTNLCTPCGLCLETFWELQMKTSLPEINFICANWDLNKILRVKLTELFPRFEAVER